MSEFLSQSCIGFQQNGTGRQRHSESLDNFCKTPLYNIRYYGLQDKYSFLIKTHLDPLSIHDVWSELCSSWMLQHTSRLCYQFIGSLTETQPRYSSCHSTKYREIATKKFNLKMILLIDWLSKHLHTCIHFNNAGKHKWNTYKHSNWKSNTLKKRQYHHGIA